MPLIVGPLSTVISPKPREEQPTPQSQPSIEQQESRRFWTAQGYPQYGGRYAPVNIPRGTKIRSVSETSEGLSISFVAVQPSKAALQKHEPLGPKEPPYQATYGLQPEPPAKVGYYYDPTGQFYKSVGYDLGAAILALKGEQAPNVPVEPRTYYTTSHDRASELFYSAEGINYPQYAGKYAPFEIPAGYQVKSITEVSVPTLETVGNITKIVYQKQLSVTFEPTEETLSRVKAQQIPTKEATIQRIGRWSELEDFGQDIANVKSNAGTSSLTEIIEQYATGLYSKDITTRTTQKIGFLPSQAPKLMIVAGVVSASESLINPNVPSIFQIGGKSPEFIVGRLIGEAMMLAGTSELFSWVAKGTLNPIKVKAESWLSSSYEEAAKAGELWQPSITERIAMRVTGAKPYLAGGEISIPVVETMSKAGVISGVPSGAPFTDIGWEMSIAPRMGGVMITKMPTVTTPKALELFFGIGKELISFDVAKGRASLKFDYSEEKPELVEKGLPKSMLEEGYYPKLGYLDRPLEEVNVRGLASWTKWPMTRSLMEEQKLLPFVTQTQVTRMGIFPYVPDMVVGSASSKGLASAFLGGASLVILPKLKQPTYEEPYALQKLKEFTLLVPEKKEKQRAIPLVTVGLGLASLTKAVSVPSSMMEEEQVQEQSLEPLQVLSLTQIQKQMQRQVQSLGQQFKTPSLQRQTTKFEFPIGAQAKMKGKKRAVKKRGEGFYLWEFPILDPEKVWKLK